MDSMGVEDLDYKDVGKAYQPSMQKWKESYNWRYLVYIWMARNDKLFNGKDISPVDTLQLASVEAVFWRKSNFPEEEEEAPYDPSVILTLPVDPQHPTCQIGASWIDDGTVSGQGWLYKDSMGLKRF